MSLDDVVVSTIKIWKFGPIGYTSLLWRNIFGYSISET